MKHGADRGQLGSCARSVAGVVGVVGEDGGGAVELLGDDEAGEGVCEGQGAEGEQELGAWAGGGGPTVCRADGEEDVLDAVVAAGDEPGGEGFGGEGAAATIEQDEKDGGAAGLAVEPSEQSRLGFESLGLAAGQ